MQKLSVVPGKWASVAKLSPMASRRNIGSLRASRPLSRQSVTVRASFNKGPKIDVADRVIAALPYLLPLLDGLKYSKFFWRVAPQAKILILPLQPLVEIFYGVPFASFIAFMAVYYFIVNNQNLSRFVRFNAMQAVVLDIVLILPGLLEYVFGRPSGGPMLGPYIIFYNTVFLFILVSCSYGIGSSLTGTWARLPFLADAADNQVR